MSSISLKLCRAYCLAYQAAMGRSVPVSVRGFVGASLFVAGAIARASLSVLRLDVRRTRGKRNRRRSGTLVLEDRHRRRNADGADPQKGWSPGAPSNLIQQQPGATNGALT